MLIRADWNVNDGIKKLINQINEGLVYATFLNFPILDINTVDMGWRIVLKKRACFRHNINRSTKILPDEFGKTTE